MGGKERTQPTQAKNSNRREEEEGDSEQESNETMPIHHLDAVPIERINSAETAFEQTNLYDFLKYKPIKKRNKKAEMESKEKLKQQIRILTRRVDEL